MTLKTWQVASGNIENWSSGNAWSPIGVPGVGDLAYFDINIGGVVVDTDVNCSGITLTSNYVGTGINDGRWNNNSGSSVDCTDLIASGTQFDCGSGTYTIIEDVDLKGDVDLGSSNISIGGDFDFDATTSWTMGTSVVTMTGNPGSIYPEIGASLYNFTIASGATVEHSGGPGPFFNVASEFNVYGNINIADGHILRVIDDCDTHVYSGGTITGDGILRMQAPTATHGILTKQGDITVDKLLVRAPVDGSRIVAGTYPELDIANTVSAAKTLALDSGVYSFQDIYLASSTSGGGDIKLSTSNGTNSVRFRSMTLTCNAADVIIEASGSETDWYMYGDISTVDAGVGDVVWIPGSGRLIPSLNLDHTIQGPSGGYIDTLTLQDVYGTTTVDNAGLAGLSCGPNTNIDFNSTNVVISGDVSAIGSNWTGLSEMTTHGDFALQDMSLLTDTWDLDLVNTSGTALGVRVSNCDASAGSGVTATNCQDSGGNDSWSFINNYTVESLPSLLKCVGFGYPSGEAGNVLTQNFREVLDKHIMGSSSNHAKSLQNIQTSPTNITIDQHGTAFENTGTIEQTSYTLPSASGGLEYTFINHSASGLDIAPNTGDQIIVSTGIISDASTYQTSGVGGVLSIVAIDTTSWIVVSEIGSFQLI